MITQRLTVTLPDGARVDVQTSNADQIRWEITPGNSSPLSDGSAAVMITSGAFARSHGLMPPARIHTMTAVGSDPLYMLTGVIPAKGYTTIVFDDVGMLDVFEDADRMRHLWRVARG